MEEFLDGRVALWIPGGGHSLFFIPVQYWWMVCLGAGSHGRVRHRGPPAGN